MVRKSKSAAEETYLAIRKDIISRRLSGGASLGEDDLAEMYHVSRTPIREAIKMLEADGLVIFYPYKGSFVKEFGEKDIIELYTVRKALEGISCRVAAENITEQNLRILEEKQEYSMEALQKGDLQLADELGDELHKGILAVSDNSQIRKIFKTISGPMDYFNFISYRMEGRMLRSLEEHKSILDALKARDGELAEQRMRLHMDSTMQEMLTAVRNARILV